MPCIQVRMSRSMGYPCRNPFLVLLPDMAVHALHPCANVQEHGVSVQEPLPCIVTWHGCPCPASRWECPGTWSIRAGTLSLCCYLTWLSMPCIQVRMSRSMEYPCRNPFLVLLPDMAVHALHPGENVQEHGVSVQEPFPSVVTWHGCPCPASRWECPGAWSIRAGTLS